MPHAADVLAQVRAAGLRTAFVTNNASRRPTVVAEHLTRLGIPTGPADVVTSAQAAARVLSERLPAGSHVLVLGTEALAEEVAAVGLQPVREVGAGVAAVAQGLSLEATWADVTEACVAIRAGALWVAGNADLTLPSVRGLVPGNGALVAALRAATGVEPVVAGKPEPALHRESVERVGAQRPLIVGDRLDTDVLGAVRGGADSLLVLTGVVDLLQAVRAPVGSRPTYVSSDLRGLLVPHLPVTVDQAEARCGEARAELAEGVLRVTGPVEDALRAACALAWASPDEVTEVQGL